MAKGFAQANRGSFSKKEWKQHTKSEVKKTKSGSGSSSKGLKAAPLVVGPGADGLNKTFAQRLSALIAASNGKISLTSGFRTRAQQAALHAAKPGLAAPPGHSNHEKGLAGDLSGDLDLAHDLAPRFGLYFPMSWEPWHVQPTGLEGMPSSAQAQDQQAYTKPPDGWQGSSSVQAPGEGSALTLGPSDPLQVLAQAFGVTDPSADLLGDITPPSLLSEDFDDQTAEQEILGQPDDELLDSLFQEEDQYGQLQSVTDGEYADLFNSAGRQYGVDPRVLNAIAEAESGFDPEVISGARTSSAGAQGLMQFMPATAEGLGINPLDPSQAVLGAAQLISSYMRQYGSLDLALAAYNAGPGNVEKYGGVPPFPETQNYILKIKNKLGWGA